MATTSIAAEINSEVYEIFRGKKLRNCCVLITTRISKADELLEFKDVHAEIIGFSQEDTKAFMRRMLGHVLDYSQGKQSPARFGKVQDFKEILAEIGKVALECLLKDDHVFEYDQLSAAILCEKKSHYWPTSSYRVHRKSSTSRDGILLFTKSIQEFLAGVVHQLQMCP
ncbi:hypothetical protein OS493_033292 [Desmophyllum pertusum]|uniref:Uncharacterized protein n=1 Tax=Desmophyllum pertusum TaxID=174260 RepID=A0A9W9ZJD0_9CNID|nr:hypothetical protein OS493_033292 [Desmophyllum pertusum]